MAYFLSDYFNLRIKGHQDIDFVDVRCDGDTKLYLDPLLIQGTTSNFGQRCARTLNSFFFCVFDACRKNDDYTLSKLLNYGREPNETHLGLSNGPPMGRGLSPNISKTALLGLKESGLFQNNIIGDPMDICTFAPNFAEDRMSDLCTNILRESLYIFTKAQLGAHMSDVTMHIAPYWDVETQSWRMGNWPALLVNEKPTLLVPKYFVTNRYVYTASYYLVHYALEYQKAKHLREESPLCRPKQQRNGSITLLPPTKKDILKAVGMSTKELNTASVLECPASMELLRRDRSNALKNPQFLSNDELDRLVYIDRKHKE